MASTGPIPRRPVQLPMGPPRASSVKSASSSVYSESPGFGRSLSNSSRETKDSLSGVDSEAGSAPPPPVPPKAPRPQPPQTPKKDVHESPNLISKFQASPPRGPEIWRRRSVKSDRSLSITDLKLVDSNGATVHPPQQPLPQRPLPAAPSHAPRGLPGRKPVPLRPAPPQPDLMGSKASKLKNKAKSALLVDSRSDEATTQPLPPIPRIGTPDHLKAGQQQSLAPQVLSPLSPNQFSNPATPAIPPKSESRRDNAPAPSSVASRPNFLSGHEREKSNESLTISSDPAVKRSPQPRQPFASRILTARTSPSTASEHASPLSPPNPSHLPAPAPEGTIFLGPELGVVHFECYHSHRLMRSCRNVVCPVACMVCKKKDTEMRFRCTWCCLSACGSCSQALSSVPGKDLKACLQKIGK